MLKPGSWRTHGRTGPQTKWSGASENQYAYNTDLCPLSWARESSQLPCSPERHHLELSRCPNFHALHPAWPHITSLLSIYPLSIQASPLRSMCSYILPQPCTHPHLFAHSTGQQPSAPYHAHIILLVLLSFLSSWSPNFLKMTLSDTWLQEINPSVSREGHRTPTSRGFSRSH